MPSIQPPRNSTQTISQVRVLVNSTGVIGRVSENHFMISLIPSRDRQVSIRCNMRTDGDDREGYIEWTMHDFLVSESEIRHWNFDASMTVGQFASLIYENHLHQFIYSGGGSGCRHWV